MSDYVFDREDIEKLRNITLPHEKGKYSEEMVLRKFKNNFLPNLRSISSHKGCMDLYDDVSNVRIEVKALIHDAILSDNEKFIRDITENSNDTAYIYINLLCKNLKTRITGNIFIINGYNLTYGTFDIIKNSIEMLCKANNTTKKLTGNYIRNANVLLNLEEVYLLEKFKEMIPRVFDNYLNLTNKDKEITELKDIIAKQKEYINKLEFEIQELKSNVILNDTDDKNNDISNMEDILDYMVKSNMEDLIKGISKKEFIARVTKYCIDKNFKIISNDNINSYMANICHKDVRVSDTDKRRAFRLLKSESIKLESDMFYEKDLDSYKLTNDNVIELEYLDYKVDATGMHNKQLSVMDILTIHKSFYVLEETIPTRKTNIRYNNIDFNLGRQLEYIRRTYNKLYNKINEECYMFNLCVEKKNIGNFIMNKLSNAIETLTPFTDVIVKTSTKSSTMTSLFKVLQKISENTSVERNSVISELYKIKNKLCDIIRSNEIVIYKNNLHKDKTGHTCLTFYKRNG